MAEDRKVPGVPGPLAAGIGECPADLTGHRGQQVPGRLAGNVLSGTCPDRACLLAAQCVADRPQVHVGDLRPVTDALPDPEQHLGHHQRRQPPQAHLAARGDRRLGQLPVPLLCPGTGRDRLPPPHVVSGAVAVLAFGVPGAGRDVARSQGGQRPHPRVGQEPFHRHPGDPAEPARVRLAQASPLPLPPARRHPQAPGDRASGRPVPQRRQLRRRGDLPGAQTRPGEPGEAPPAQPAGPGAMRGGIAAARPAYHPAQQRMPGGQGQHPAAGIPPRPGQERLIQHRGQAGGRSLEQDPVQHAGELAARTRGRGCRQRGRSAGHRVTPACSRGLGTASTAARSRPGSGCTYTCDDDTEAWPSRSATTSMPHPASAALLPKACRS